ncbi:MAG: type 4a pilus biogenesis protein PilO [Gammaproteobacteria bacterium]
MNFLEELQSLDINDIGRWPLIFRILFIGLAFLLVVGFGYWKFIHNGILPKLDKEVRQEETLKSEFTGKQRKAANLDAYKAQLDEMNANFGTMLRQLPGQTEIPSLLVDISQTGLASGLEEELFQPTSEAPKEFYAEKPISIRLTGSYHELGQFVSGIAALPRIVTLHDIDIKPVSKDPGADLTLNVTAKTYRYLEEDEEVDAQ